MCRRRQREKEITDKRLLWTDTDVVLRHGPLRCIVTIRKPQHQGNRLLTVQPKKGRECQLQAAKSKNLRVRQRKQQKRNTQRKTNKTPHTHTHNTHQNTTQNPTSTTHPLRPATMRFQQRKLLAVEPESALTLETGRASRFGEFRLEVTGESIRAPGGVNSSHCCKVVEAPAIGSLSTKAATGVHSREARLGGRDWRR